MSTKMIGLLSSDGKRFEIEEAIARQCQTIALTIDEDSFAEEEKDYVLDVESKILAKVIEYCKKHHVDDANPSSAKDLKKWDEQFMDKQTKTYIVFDLNSAAENLKIKSLYDLTNQTITDRITKTPDDILSFEGIK